MGFLLHGRVIGSRGFSAYRWTSPENPSFRRSGAPDRIRTCDLRLRRPTLYPLSYRRAVFWLEGPGMGFGHGTRGAGPRHGPRIKAHAKTEAPAEAGASIAAGFANRKGIFHARFPALP